MRLSDAILSISTAIILLVVLVSGPLVPIVDFTTSPLETSVPVDDINATVAVIEPPTDEFYIGPGRGETELFIHTSAIRINVIEVTGTPIIVYELKVDELNQIFASITVLSEKHEGHDLRITIERIPVPRDSITKSSYDGRLSLRVRAGNGSTEVYEQNVTVPVVGNDEG